MAEKSINVSYHILKDSVIINYKGQTHQIGLDDLRYKSIISLIKNRKLSRVPEALKKLDNVKKQAKSVPHELHHKLLELKKEGFPVTPLKNLLAKLEKNPDSNCKKYLYNFLQHNGHPITTAGNFIAYKKVREDFKDCHSGTFLNTIGKIIEMPREKVDSNPNNTCSHGLHVASYSYAKDFSSGIMLEVEIDPTDVVAVPVDYENTKMRVCRYKVLRKVEEVSSDVLRKSKSF
jgi:hypothetical protein